ncbi:ABC transporter permease [Calidithermus chliarophilus]|uniref:ABC transporter permease n=1 Tax=Calidithermus chliarophilus TaxID=52023 RepID=UPI00042A00C6|nr:iron ABC transporter permease [Calidithermus chliarophilus]
MRLSPLLALPVLLFLALALGYPLARVLLLGLGEGLGETLHNPYYWGRLGWSLGYGLASSLLTVLLALPLAYAFRYRFPGREALLSLSTVPFVLPTLVVALGFLALAGPRGLLGLNLQGTPWILLWAAVFYNLGLVLRLLVVLLPSLETPLAAARTLGASPWRAYLRVGVPLLAPGLLAGGGLTFLYTFSSFGLPLVLGGTRYATLEVEIYTLLSYRLAFPEATALALAQLAVSAGVTLLYLWAQARLALSLQSGAGPRTLPRPKAWALALALWLGFALLYAPLLALLLQALQHPAAFTSVWRGDGFTPAGEALWNTLRFAGLTLLLAFPIGFLYAYAVWRGERQGRGTRWLDLSGMLPLLVSPVLVGLGYLLAYPRLSGSLVLLVAAYTLLSYPLLSRALLPALRAMPHSVLEAARTLGAGPWRRLWRVEWPLLQPALRSGAALTLAAVVGEFGATLVLRRPEWTTLSLAIYERLGRPGATPFAEALALAVLLGLLAGGVFYLLDRGRGTVG